MNLIGRLVLEIEVGRRHHFSKGGGGGKSERGGASNAQLNFRKVLEKSLVCLLLCMRPKVF